MEHFIQKDNNWFNLILYQKPWIKRSSSSTPTQCVSAGKTRKVKLVHLYGYVACADSSPIYWSHWGCGLYKADSAVRILLSWPWQTKAMRFFSRLKCCVKVPTCTVGFWFLVTTLIRLSLLCRFTTLLCPLPLVRSCACGISRIWRNPMNSITMEKHAPTFTVNSCDWILHAHGATVNCTNLTLEY